MASFRKPCVVVGGGVAGLTSALALRRAGFGVRVLESDDSFNVRRMGVPIWGGALHVLDRLGLGAEIRKRAVPITQCEIASLTKTLSVKQRLSKVVARFTLEEYSQGSAADAYVLDRAELQQILMDALPSGTVWRNTRFGGIVRAPVGAPAQSLQQLLTVQVLLKNVREPLRVETPLLVGADGKRSLVRGHMGVASTSQMRYAGFTQWQGMVDLTRLILENRMTRQQCLETFESTTAREIWGQGGRFGYMMMWPGMLYWYCTCNAQSNEVFLRPFKPKLLERFRDWPQECIELIQACDEATIFRNNAYNWASSDLLSLRGEREMMRMPTFRGRAVLVGNAGYSFTYNMHQQTCLAMEDAFALAQLLSQYGLKDNIALRIYSEDRIMRTRAHGRSAARLVGIARWEYPFLLRLRDRILDKVSSHARLRKYLSLIGFFEAGDLPISPISREGK
ncbi:FAD-dependent urate hydroxylase [Porphyridium purpureum]|uniref:FAD-dependent urate hydroxylase n=1 Tax=Porphyridium purpureum TaxID=35688 RepID=A0A5J4Z8C7_PORPP|nr:FAD-dependent urate hydroxylase [Porphyridium purpureum]|eukprot:POR5706..scf295_1